MTRCQRQGRLQRRRLSSGKTAEPIEQWSTHLLQPGEGQLHLRLHADTAYHLALAVPGDVVQQRGLPRTRCPMNHEGPASTPGHRADQTLKRSTLSTPANELYGITSADRLPKHSHTVTASRPGSSLLGDSLKSALSGRASTRGAEVLLMTRGIAACQ